LCKKWERELRETIPNVHVIQLDDWRDVVKLRHGPRRQPVWLVIGRDKAKLGAKWRPAYCQRRGEQFLRCPRCHARLVKDMADDKARDTNMAQDGLSLTVEDLTKKRMYCQNAVGKKRVCGEPLWQLTREVWR
jgi:uncharacterized C2H2 Zn-finger protein